MNISDYITNIKTELEKVQNQLQKAPTGKLIAAKNDTRYKYYIRENSVTSYLTSKERELACQLAEKRYLQKRENYLKKALAGYEYLRKAEEIKGEIYQELYAGPNGYNRLLFENSGNHQENISNLEIANRKQINDNWEKEEYIKNEKYPEKLIYDSVSGSKVRSKSEAIIDMILSTNHIPFHYEEQLILEDKIFYPDFTTKHPITGEIHYWEHFGMMDDPNYSANVFKKLKIYADNGIIPGINLITTFETNKNPLNPLQVECIVKSHFGHEKCYNI